MPTPEQIDALYDAYTVTRRAMAAWLWWERAIEHLKDAEDLELERNDAFQRLRDTLHETGPLLRASLPGERVRSGERGEGAPATCATPASSSDQAEVARFRDVNWEAVARVLHREFAAYSAADPDGADVTPLEWFVQRCGGKTREPRDG